MNLIDKYIAEVGKHLPRRNRADIEAEIRSTLEDMLEERKQTHADVDDAMIVELLKEYGAPRKVAESYVGPRYLIGPRMYPIFEMVTRIVLIVLFAVTLAALGMSLARSSVSGLELLKTIGESALGLLGGLITAFGHLVLIFAILERFLPTTEFEKELEDWDPADLASEPDPGRVKFGEQIFEIIFLVLFLVILNLYPGMIGFGFFIEGDWTFISPILTDAFFSYLPWINALFLLQIIFSVYLLRQGWWSTGLRIANLILELASIALAVVMLRGPALAALTSEQLANSPLAESAQILTTIINLVPTLALTVVIIVSSIEVAQMIYHLVKSRPSSPYPVIK